MNVRGLPLRYCLERVNCNFLVQFLNNPFQRTGIQGNIFWLDDQVYRFWMECVDYFLNGMSFDVEEWSHYPEFLNTFSVKFVFKLFYKTSVKVVYNGTCAVFRCTH